MVMSRMADNAMALAIIVSFFWLIYSKIKKETLKETFAKIKKYFGDE